MNILGNIIWFIFGGFFSGLSWCLSGIIWCITIVGIPYGKQCFKFASLAFTPFGKDIEYGGGIPSLFANVIWIIFFGIPMAVENLLFGCIWCITIVGIPFGLQFFKIAKLALAQFGAIVKLLINNIYIKMTKGENMFKLHSEYKPTGDQPQAIEYLSKGIEEGKKYQTLLGVTGSGKTFTMANIINKVQKPTLVLAHNKTLAGQLYSEFKEFFPENNVEYFVSYYDYYQPESYIPSTDTYIEKDSSINDEIDKLRHSATLSLFETRDVIIVASVSCIYGLGDPVDYQEMMLSLRPGMQKSRDEVLKKLITMQYTRNELDFKRGTFRAKGDIVEIYPSDQSESAVRVEFWGDEIERIVEINALTGKALANRRHILISPASHYVTTKEKMERAIVTIEKEMEERVKYFKGNNKLIEAQRIEERTNFDIEMMKETGFCSGIENYSRHISGRPVGSPPYTLFDYFPKDFLLLIDESHATIPQVKAMYNGDRARKESLVNYGFRLPSAFDNRPLTFKEFEERINQVVFVSATPADYEKEHSKDNVVEQIIRPTGLLDPKIEVKPVENQIDDLLEQIRIRVAKKERVLVTTLTKRMAEDLTEYLKELDIKVNYMHSDTKALERMKIIRDLRLRRI